MSVQLCNGVPASGCDTAPLSYLIYSALFMPAFCEGGSVLIIYKKQSSAGPGILQFTGTTFWGLCPSQLLSLNALVLLATYSEWEPG